MYDERLQYHNFNHPLETIRNSKVLIDRCREEKLPVNEKVVYLALLFHDAGYAEDFKEKGFATKERYSAHLAVRALEESGEDLHIIEMVSDAIMATERGREAETNEQKIVRAADLMGLAYDYAEFMKNNKDYKAETEMLENKKIPWPEWQAKCKNNLELYLSQDIRITRAHDDMTGESDFHKKAYANLKRFLAEPTEPA